MPKCNVGTSDQFQNLDEANKFINGTTKKRKVNVRRNAKAKPWRVTNPILIDNAKEVNRLIMQKGHGTRGESMVETYLNIFGVEYMDQVTIEIHGYTHRFDFAIFDKNHNLCAYIEFDGPQHSKPILAFGGEEGFRKQMFRDKQKDQYCLEKKIIIFRIPYLEANNIESLLRRTMHKYISREPVL